MINLKNIITKPIQHHPFHSKQDVQFHQAPFVNHLNI